MVLRVAPAQGLMAEEQTQRAGTSAEDVIRQARISHSNTMALHMSCSTATRPKQSMVRVQYELGTSLPYDYVSKDSWFTSAGHTDQPAPAMPKTITVKPTPRFGAVMMAVTAVTAAAAAAAGTGAAAAVAASGPASAPSTPAATFSSGPNSHGGGHGAHATPPDLAGLTSPDVDTATDPPGPTSLDTSDDDDDGAAAIALATAAAHPEAAASVVHRAAGLGTATIASSNKHNSTSYSNAEGESALAGDCLLPGRSASTSQRRPPGLGLGPGRGWEAAAAALRGRLRRMSATDASTPLLYTSRMAGAAASIDGSAPANAPGPSSTGSLFGAAAVPAQPGNAAAAAAGAGPTSYGGGGVDPRDPWNSSTAGFTAPRCGGGDAVHRIHVASHLLHACSDTGPAAYASWSALTAPLVQQLEALSPRNELRSATPVGEGPTSGRGRGLAARAAVARPSATGTNPATAAAAAAGGGFGDGDGAADDGPLCALQCATSLPGSVVSYTPPPHMPLQRRSNFHLSQLTTGDTAQTGSGGLPLRPTPPALGSPLQSSPAGPPQLFGSVPPLPLSDGPCSAPTMFCGGVSCGGGGGFGVAQVYGASQGAFVAGGAAPQPAAPDSPSPRVTHVRPRRTPAAAASPPTSSGVPALHETVALSTVNEPSQVPRFGSSCVGASGSASFRWGYGSAVQSSPIARHHTLPAGEPTATTRSPEARDGGSNLRGGAGAGAGLGEVATSAGVFGAGVSSAASDAAVGGVDGVDGCKGYGSLLHDNRPEDDKDYWAASPFVSPASAEEELAPLPPHSAPLSRPAPMSLLPSTASGCGGSGAGAWSLPPSPGPHAFRSPSQSDDSQTSQIPTSAPGAHGARLPAAATATATAAAAAAAAAACDHRGMYNCSFGPSRSSPLPPPLPNHHHHLVPLQKQSPPPSPLPQHQQQQSTTTRRRAADGNNNKQLHTAAAAAGSPAAAAAAAVGDDGASASAASSPASCPDPGTPTSGGGRPRFANLGFGLVLGGGSKRGHSVDRHQGGLNAGGAAVAAAAAALPLRGLSGGVPEATAPPPPLPPTGAGTGVGVGAAAVASGTPPALPQSLSGGSRDLLPPGRGRGRGGGGSVDISAEEHQDIMTRMKSALSFLRHGD